MKEGYMRRREKRCLIAVTIIIISMLVLAETQAANLVWQTSKQAAVDLATQQGKKILLLAGRDT